MEQRVNSFDLKIFAVTLILIGIGVAFMYGASAQIAERLFSDRAHFFNRELIYGIVSIFLILFVSRINPNIFFRLSNLLFILTIISLVLVLIPGIGIEIKGARRWIHLGLFNFQPSEIAKITVLIYLSKLLTQENNDLKNFTKGLLPILLTIGLVFVLIFVEEDFSSSVLLLIVSLNLIFIAGVPFRYFVYLAASGIPVLYFLVTSFGHMKARLSGYLKKFFIVNYTNYQEKQAAKAIQNADLFGNGLGIGSYHARIPESHTDFYFASIVADIGLIGGLVIIMLFLYLFIKSFKLAYHIKEKQFAFLVYGITLILVWQTVLNLGSVLGLLPIAGLTLPFLSYGGNSLISSSLGIGIILSISRYHSSS